jgi:hypothetical protein
MPIHDDSTIARFWCKVNVRGPDECWPWLGGKAHKGYGYFFIRNSHERHSNGKLKTMNRHAHRVSYEIAKGDTLGLDVLHSCDNPPCCNPDHLWPGTALDNMQDKARKGRQTRGATHPCTKLTEAEVIEVRRLIANGGRNIDIGAQFGVERATISCIRSGKTWAWLK